MGYQLDGIEFEKDWYSCLHDDLWMPLEHARPQIETLQKGNGYPFYGRR